MKLPWTKSETKTAEPLIALTRCSTEPTDWPLQALATGK